MQSESHGAGYDYNPSSPHLAHPQLRNMIGQQIRLAVSRAFDRVGRCRVLEIGAGHGAFTDYSLAAGATVTVTEMSQASATMLGDRFRHNDRVTVQLDADGERVFEKDTQYDVILCLSVLHHIPDYLRHVERLTDLQVPGGDLISFQDPLWYPRRSRVSMLAQQGAYFAWRIGQGNLKQGLATRVRRVRGQLDEARSEDMVEYHVVRQGVDEEALVSLLNKRYAAVGLSTYWSTQNRGLQRIGERLKIRSNFGIVATDRR